MLNVPQGRALGSFPFLSSHLVIHTSERNICVLSSTCLAKKDSQMHIKKHNYSSSISAPPKQIPSPTQGPTLTFAVTR